MEVETGPCEIPCFETLSFQMRVFKAEVTVASGQNLIDLNCLGTMWKTPLSVCEIKQQKISQLLNIMSMIIHSTFSHLLLPLMKPYDLNFCHNSVRHIKRSALWAQTKGSAVFVQPN